MREKKKGRKNLEYLEDRYMGESDILQKQTKIYNVYCGNLGIFLIIITNTNLSSGFDSPN